MPWQLCKQTKIEACKCLKVMKLKQRKIYHEQPTKL